MKAIKKKVTKKVTKKNKKPKKRIPESESEGEEVCIVEGGLGGAGAVNPGHIRCHR